MDDNPTEGVTVDMFDFALGSKKRKNTLSEPKLINELENSVLQDNHKSVNAEVVTEDIKEEGMSY